MKKARAIDSHGARDGARFLCFCTSTIHRHAIRVQDANSELTSSSRRTPRYILLSRGTLARQNCEEYLLSLVHRPFLKLHSFTVAGAVMSASGQAPNSKTNELTNAQQKGPLIPETFIDVPSQRLYVVSLWLLCQVSPPSFVFNIRGVSFSTSIGHQSV